MRVKVGSGFDGLKATSRLRDYLDSLFGCKKAQAGIAGCFLMVGKQDGDDGHTPYFYDSSP